MADSRLSRRGLAAAAAAVIVAAAAPAHSQTYSSRAPSGSIDHLTSFSPPGTIRFAVPDSPKRYRMVPLPATPPPSSPERRLGKYDDLISECAREFDVDPALVKAVIRAESGFDSRAVSPRGARGLMQLMPRTARGQGVSDVHDPRQNVRAGVRYLRMLLDRYQGDRRLALAAYNAGSGAVKRYGGLPPHRETRTYVGRVLQFHKQYERSRHRSSPAAPVPRAALRAEADPFAPVAVPDVRPITGCWTLARSAACTP